MKEKKEDLIRQAEKTEGTLKGPRGPKKYFLFL